MFNMKLPRQFDRGFHCLRAARDEIDFLKAGGSMRAEQAGKLFCGCAGEKPRMREGQCFCLCFQRVNNFRIAMPEAGYRRAAGSIKIFFPVFII